MFEFGRELKRILGASAAPGDADPSLLELLDLHMLAGQGRAADVAAGRVSTKDPHPSQLDSAAIWREHARRSGDLAALRKSAAQAQRAAESARTDRERSRAALEQALTSIVAADLYGDAQTLTHARELLKAAAATEAEVVLEARIEAAYARLSSREALAHGDYDRALEAAALFDSAIHKLDRLAAERGSPAVRLEAALAHAERADLLAGFGLRLQEPRLLEGAARDASRLLERLDPDYEPLTWARTAELLGGALVGLGEVGGRADLIAEGVSALAEIGERFTRDHSPLDWARYQHALGVALQALGEACDSDAAFAQAEKAFELSIVALGSRTVVMRATVANNRAACLARRAERRGDVVALSKAEAAFKTELAGALPEVDPVAWAVLQVNLARVYEARAELLGVFREREAAVYALEAALDVFCENGLKSLAEAASAALERVRGATG
jgi:tetratricopeptide (TPR) repeat protein